MRERFKIEARNAGLNMSNNDLLNMTETALNQHLGSSDDIINILGIENTSLFDPYTSSNRNIIIRDPNEDIFEPNIPFEIIDLK